MPEEDLYGPSFYDARPWIVFNDFTISYIRQEEALGFAGNWKVSLVMFIMIPTHSCPVESRSPQSSILNVRMRVAAWTMAHCQWR